MILDFVPRTDCDYRLDFKKIQSKILEHQRKDNDEALQNLIAACCLDSLFFLGYFVCDLKPLNHPFLVDRCNEVEDCSNMTLDLWAREHWKSTIITYLENIRKTLQDPENRIGIFSHVRSIAKAFLRRIKLTLETNIVLRLAFPDVLYWDPKKDSPKWSEDEGLIVKRKGVYAESTFEAWGLIDQMPTAKHFTVLNYEDIITDKTVTNPEMIQKVTDQIKLSYNLGVTEGGTRRIIGTIYDFGDYHHVLKEECEEGKSRWNLRLHPGEDANGTPILYTKKQLQAKKEDMGSYIYACQILLDPIDYERQVFKESWLLHYDKPPFIEDINIYILVDPAEAKEKRSDFTAIEVWGVTSQKIWFLLDMVVDKLSLTEKWKALKKLLQKYPTTISVGYEKYGLQGDISHYKDMMEREKFFFHIIPLGGNQLSKPQRIMQLVPLFEYGRIRLPGRLMYKGRDLIWEFEQQEYLRYPHSVIHDDILDCAARITDTDLNVIYPTRIPQERKELDPYAQKDSETISFMQV